MADVTEVIHRITYEVNNDALNNATVAIQAQLAELNKLSTALDGYSRQLQNMSSRSLRSMDELSAKISNVHQQIAASVAKTEGLLTQAGKGMLKGLDISRDVEGAVAKIFTPIRKELDKIGTDSAISFKNIATSLTSFTSVVEISIGLLSTLGQEMYAVDGAFSTLTESELAAYEVQKKVTENYTSQQIHLQLLNEEVNNNETSLRRLKEIRDELVGSYPGLENNLKGEANLQFKLADSIGKVNQALLLNARIKAAEELLVENEKEFLSDDLGFWDGLQVGALNSISLGMGTMYITEQKLEKYNKNKANLQRVIEEGRAEQEKTGLYNITTTAKPQNVNRYSPASTSSRKIARKKTPPQREQQEAFYLSTRSPQELPVSIDGSIQPLDTERMQREQREKDEAEAKAKRKENIKSAIDDYKTLSDAAVEAYDKIIKAQIEALDKEISLREKRVEEAKKLAERGNVEALRLEEERLRKAQEQRARFARQQQAVNAAITVSNAIAAVARAALEGGGFGSAATIAALIAALAAGYAAVSSLGNDSGDSFADGVVGYKGKGGPRDDKNWVRISSGESIITAEGTQKNRALLEAINQGAALHMIDPSLPLMMPLFKQPGITNNNYAAAKDLKQLEGKLDEVVGAIEGNRLRQNIFFNEQGVGIMTERAVKKERKRWM